MVLVELFLWFVFWFVLFCEVFDFFVGDVFIFLYFVDCFLVFVVGD